MRRFDLDYPEYVIIRVPKSAAQVIEAKLDVTSRGGVFWMQNLVSLTVFFSFWAGGFLGMLYSLSEVARGEEAHINVAFLAGFALVGLLGLVANVRYLQRVVEIRSRDTSLGDSPGERPVP